MIREQNTVERYKEETNQWILMPKLKTPTGLGHVFVVQNFLNGPNNFNSFKHY